MGLTVDLPMSERFPLVSFGLHFQQPKATILHISCCLSRYSFASRSKISRDALLTNNIPSRRVQVLLVKNEKEHAWAINSRNID